MARKHLETGVLKKKYGTLRVEFYDIPVNLQQGIIKGLSVKLFLK